MSPNDTAVVFDVQRFSIHDGPGIRTVVFLKGCTMACAWCHNPEAMGAEPELAWYEERCLPDCRLCVDACPEGALGPERAARVDFARCTACGRCADVCPVDALRIVGRALDAESLLDEVRKDRPFYDASGGGVTLSGGEPVLHFRFLQRFLPRTRDAGLRTAIETAGCYDFSLLEPLLPYLELVLFDLKLIDGERHQRATGQHNALILGNLGRLVALGAPLQVRMPVVPGINTDAGNVAATAELLRGLGIRHLALLPYNALWEAKLPRLATRRRGLGIRPPEEAFYVALEGAFECRGVAARRPS